jgi:putative tryptophan/tyrosine transport system permease protein
MSLILWIGALTQGLAYAFLAWGIYLSFRVLSFADITADGSFPLGAAVAAVLLSRGASPLLAMPAAVAAGALAGLVTGILHTRFGINDLLSGILTMTALYSVNLHVMGRSNISLLDARTAATLVRERIPAADAVSDDMIFLALFLVAALLFGAALAWLLRTDFGMALRATGDNPVMITAQGADTRRLIVAGLALSNALVALAGALVAQYQGFADVGMGVGALVTGLAALILGETLVGRRGLGGLILGVALGAVVFRLLIALALRVGLNPIDLKLVTAAFVFLALGLPRLRRGRRAGAAAATVAAKAA